MHLPSMLHQAMVFQLQGKPTCALRFVDLTSRQWDLIAYTY